MLDFKINLNKTINVYIRGSLVDVQIAILGECKHEHYHLEDEEARHQ